MSNKLTLMGIYDRDYYRTPVRSNMFNSMRIWTVNTWLIAINVAIFVIDAVSGYQLRDWGAFTISQAIGGLQIWRFLTLQFIHFGVQHIAFNMIALFFFGPMVESVLGARRYLAFYLTCGVASGLMYVVLWATHILDGGPYSRLGGASGSIFGVLIAAALIAPNVTVMLNFFIPMKLRTMAWVLLGIAIFTVISKGPNAGGEAAHIGGAIAGYLLIKNPVLLNWSDFRRGSRMRFRH